MTGFDRDSRSGDPSLINRTAGDWCPNGSGPAWEMGVGWLTVPHDVDKWTARFLPPFAHDKRGQ